jgi:hypothetical protein
MRTMQVPEVSSVEQFVGFVDGLRRINTYF